MAAEQSPTYIDLGGVPIEGSHATAMVFVPGSVTETGQDQMWVGRSGGASGWSGQADSERVRIFTAAGESMRTGVELSSGVVSMSIRHNQVWCGLEDGSVSLVSTRSMRQTLTWRAHNTAIVNLKLLGGDKAFSVSSNGKVRLWDSGEACQMATGGSGSPPAAASVTETELSDSLEDLLNLGEQFNDSVSAV